MEEKKIVCDTDVMIDYWDETKARHKETKLILENGRKPTRVEGAANFKTRSEKGILLTILQAFYSL